MSFHPNRRDEKPQTTEEWAADSTIDYTHTAASSSASVAQQYGQNQHSNAVASSSTAIPRQYEHNQHTDSSSWTNTDPSADNEFAMSHSLGWQTDPSRQVLLDSLQTPTQSTYFDMSLTPSASNASSSMTWPATLVDSLQCNAYLSNQQDQLMATMQQQSSYALGIFPPGPSSHPSYTWPLVQGSASLVVPDDLSPGRSDHSTPSQASAVSSPPVFNVDRGWYGHDSPPIKIETPSESDRRRLRSAPDDMLMSRHPHVNPNDIYNPPISNSSHQPSASPDFSPKHEDESVEQERPLHTPPQQPTIHRSVSLKDSRDNRPDKRGFTSKANSTCSCKLCGRVFQRSYNLRAHMETHNPARDQPWKCQYDGCDRRFVRKTDLVRHWDSVSLSLRWLFNSAIAMQHYAYRTF
jgi:hypothetical protein